MGKVIAVSSGKGGTGKSTAVAALSSCLAVLGHKTLCIDFDAELRNLDLMLGMTDFTVKDYMDVVDRRVSLMDACSSVPKVPNLYFLSAPTEPVSDDVNPAELKPMFDEIRREFEYCLIDSPSGIGSGFKFAHSNVDLSIIVTTGEFTSMRDANRTAAALREAGINKIRLLVNRVQPGNFRRIKTTVDDVIDNIGVQLLGLIPEDKYIFRAIHTSTPLVLYKKRHSAYDFLDAARRITGDEVPLQQYKYST